MQKCNTCVWCVYMLSFVGRACGPVAKSGLSVRYKHAELSERGLVQVCWVCVTTVVISRIHIHKSAVVCSVRFGFVTQSCHQSFLLHCPPWSSYKCIFITVLSFTSVCVLGCAPKFSIDLLISIISPLVFHVWYTFFHLLHPFLHEHSAPSVYCDPRHS